MAEPGFEDFEGLTADQRYAKLKQIIRGADDLLNRNGVLRIQSRHNPHRYWQIDGVDAKNVAADAAEGSLREGGFRETIYLLLMAGF